MSDSAWLCKHPWLICQTHQWPTWHSYNQLWGHPYLENWMAIRRAVVYYAQAAHAFSAGIICQHCNSFNTLQSLQTRVVFHCIPSSHPVNTFGLLAVANQNHDPFRSGCPGRTMHTNSPRACFSRPRTDRNHASHVLCHVRGHVARGPGNQGGLWANPGMMSIVLRGVKVPC